MTVENRTATVTVNAAFLQEIKDVHQELWRAFTELQGICHDAQQIHERPRDVVELLIQLRDQLALHFSLEEAYGYFDDPIRVAPHLSESAKRLRDEHEVLYGTFATLTEDMEERHRSGELPKSSDELVERFSRYYTEMQSHEARENELILRAYDDDIGVGD